MSVTWAKELARHNIRIAAIAPGFYRAMVEAMPDKVLDKTGTITRGEPRLTEAVAAEGVDESHLLTLAASVENASEHPIARAIVDGAKERDVKPGEVSEFRSTGARGVSGKVGDETVLIGNRRLLEEEGVTGLDALADDMQALENKGRTVVAAQAALCPHATGPGALSSGTDGPGMNPGKLCRLARESWQSDPDKALPRPGELAAVGIQSDVDLEHFPFTINWIREEFMPVWIGQDFVSIIIRLICEAPGNLVDRE